MRRIILTCIVISMSMLAFSQKMTKTDMRLRGMMHQNASSALHKASPQAQQSERVIVNAVMLKGANVPEQQLKDLGIKVESRIGRFLTLSVPVAQIAALDNLEGFESFEANRTYNLSNHNSQVAMSVIPLQNDSKSITEGLPQTYTGEGVMVGVFDSGIDFNHVNFRDSLTHKTRIIEANVYSKDVNITYPIISVTGDDIDTLTTDNRAESHGSHTAGTAAGSYNGNYSGLFPTNKTSCLKGIANKADLVLCGSPKIPDNQLENALHRMDSIATLRNEPLVVNLSLGTTNLWLDGKLPINKFFDDFTDNGNKPGRIVCVSAGNEGGINFSMHKELNNSNNHTIRSFISNITDTDSTRYFWPFIVAFSDDSTHFDFALEEYDSLYVLQRTLTEDSMKATFGEASIDGTWYSDHDGRYAKALNNLMDPSFRYRTKKNNHWALRITSDTDCKFRAYALAYLGESVGYHIIPFNSLGQEGFTDGDPTSSFNNIACTYSVLSVGAWQANNKYKIWTGTRKRDDEKNNNHIATFSSWVDADDYGNSHPDFAAPGFDVLSGLNSYDRFTYKEENGFVQAGFQLCGRADEEYLEGHCSIFGVMSGTSMACPNAVGVIALLLQEDPTLTVNQIREIIKETANNDEYTALVPNRFGAGKLNALAAMKKVIANKQATAISDVRSSSSFKNSPAVKLIRNGRIIVEKDGRRYTVTGQREL